MIRRIVPAALQGLLSLCPTTALRLAVFASVFALLPPVVLANTLSDNITVKGGTVVEDGDDVVITFTREKIESDGAGSLSFKAGSASADVLAVGGGGGGGRTTSTTSGGGGGGGGGGFVAASGLLFKGSYVISVGAGGVGADATVASSTAGSPGGDTTIRKNDLPIDGIADAEGGGGGGAETAGSNGGCGGGGSIKGSSTKNGGTGSQGGNGGKGLHSYVGAGGGGAGGSADDTYIDGTMAMATAGGQGKASSITGTEVYYAGGGAGGDIRASGGSGVIAGALGGGGSGGSGTNKESRDGVNGLGGGGGGGAGVSKKTKLASGKGGDGVMIIRLSNYVAGGVVVPTIESFTYDGTEKTAATATAYYTISSGAAKGTNAGTYTFTIRLTDAGEKLGWDDETDPRISADKKSATVEWKILPKPVDKPELTATSFTYTGSPQTGYETSSDYTLDDQNTATDAGTYTVTATLVDAANTMWSDLTGTAAQSPRSDLSWTIAKKSIAKPSRVSYSDYTYDGNAHTGYVANAAYTFSSDGLYLNVATNAATYSPKATLTDTKNTKWADYGSATRTDLSWTIKTAEVSKPIAATGFTFDNTEKTCLEPTDAYGLVGNKATNAGTYTFTATLNNPEGFTNYKWKNSDAEPYSATWSIAKRSVPWTDPTTTFAYEKGTVREPVAASDWYTVTGDTKAEDVGDYACEVALNYNTETLTNVVWSAYETSEVEVKKIAWSITACEVDVPTVSDYTYAESPKGSAVSHTVLTIAADAPYEKAAGEDELTQSQTGDYSFTLTLKDTKNYVWKTDPKSSDPQSFKWQILKDQNEIYGVKLDDWQYGDTSSRTPSCDDVKYGNKTGVKYYWSTSPTGPDWTLWDNATRPSAAGTYYLQAATPETTNWHATNVVKRFCVWTNPAEVFTDYMDISIYGASAACGTRDDGYTTVLVKLREPVGGSGAITAGFPGFEYARTGTQASEIRFVLTNAVKIADKLLPFSNLVWNVSGESQLLVRVPKATGLVKTIRMYYHAADGDPKSDNYPEDVGAAGTFDARDFTLVNREGSWYDYWTELPTITKTIWQADETLPTESDITDGKLKAGSINRVYLTMPRATTNETIQTAPGTYVVVFDRKPTEGESYTLYGGEKRLQYEIVWHNTYENLGGTAGGRILLGNNDTMSGHEITGQAYWQTDPANGTYWTHEGSKAHGAYPNLDDYIRHTFSVTDGSKTNVLWRLWDMRIGSSYGNSGTPASYRNYLPWSSTCQPRTSATATMSSKEVSYLVFRNTSDAVLYSSCYSNGIGTVYFDLVNVEAATSGQSVDQYSQVIVEVATVTSEGKEPTDENCAKGDNPFYWLTHSPTGEDLPEADDMWLPIKPKVLIKNAGSDAFVEDTAQTKLSECLIEPRIHTGGGTEAFYRICASTNYAKSCRFRIRRKGDIVRGEDSSNLLLLDNVIVSPPPMYATLEAPGVSDATSGRIGKQTLGQAGALSTAFPAKTDTGVLGRAKVHFATTPGLESDLKTFVASARFNYRWRYLNQSFGDWTTVYLDHNAIVGTEGEIIPTVGAIDFTGRDGDVEWYYDMTLHAPAYKYVDYSGCGVEKPVDGYNEEVQAITNRQSLASSVRQASAGSDWFVRLREGKSDWEGMKVVITSDDDEAQQMVGDYPMELIGDNMWRAMVIVPTNAEGTCKFHFLANNLHENGDPDNVTTEWMAYGGKRADAVEIPTSGELVEGATEVPFTIDHAAGYLEFKMSDRYLTYQVGRAEFQDFNNWNDAHTPNPLVSTASFIADSSDSNSVSVADMKTERAEFGSWTPFAATNENWTESFILTDYSAEGSEFEKEIFHSSCQTPNQSGVWSAQNITFVSERLVSAKVLVQKEQSGLAGKLLGSGSGALTFLGTTTVPPPQGLEKVEVKARLGQSYTFDAFTYSKAAYNDDNYMFFAPVTMSHRTKDDDTQEVADMAVGASVSMIGYYGAETGCYEFRVERLYTNLDGSSMPTVRLSIYKWYVDGFVWTNKRLCYRDFDNQALWTYECNKDGVWTQEAARKFYGMFISFDTTFSDGEHGTDPTSTRIVCGLSDAHTTDHVYSWKNFDNAGTNTAAETATYLGLTYTDTSNPYGWGSYGVCAKDCPSQFVMPAHAESPFKGTIKEEKVNAKPTTQGKEGGDGNGQYFRGETFKLFAADQPVIQDRDKLSNSRYWATIPGRCESFVNPEATPELIVSDWIGLRTPTNLVQDLELYLKPQGTGLSQWKKYGTQKVSGYGFNQLPIYDVKRTGQWDMELRTGSTNAIDVVVDDVRQYRWQAPDINDPKTIVVDDRSKIYVYSQALVYTNATEKKQYVRFQPARATATRPISIRSPIMNGLGKFTFSYRDPDDKAELWVQVATNHVSGNLSGTGHYNDSIVSKDLGEQQEIGEWLTVAKYSTTATGEYLLEEGGGAKTVYLGWHNHPDRPIKGIFRLFVPPSVVEKAIVAATNATQDVDYGAVTVTAASCTDEPGVSDRSWRGLNMRTVGDSSDSEARMNLVDMVVDEDGGNGLVAALNNSWNDVRDKNGNVIDGTDKKYAAWHPTIFSPTMKPLKKDRGVGSVTVKARLYSTNDRPTTDGGGRIVVYGARDSRATDWTVLCTNFVTSSVFTNFSWSAGKEVYTAVKFEVTESAAAGSEATVDRVIIDEITIGEKVPPTINFVYARPFRMNLFSKEPIEDILSPAEQPLSGESWGVQTQLSLQQLTDEIDVEKGFEVHLSYFRGEEPWGYAQWKSESKAVDGIALLQVGDKSNLVFRSYGDAPESLVSPSGESSEIVQFMLTVKYWDRGGKSDEMTLSSWEQPDWFYPLDKNAEYGGDADENKFSAYTVLDTVSPGRAWINEANWNDGPMTENGGKKCITNQFLELCVPAGTDLSGWYVRVTDPNLNQRVLARLGDTAGGIPGSKAPTANCTNGYEFLVLKSPQSTIPQADASWYSFDMGDDIRNGTLPYNDPLQFELVRPSGVIEHQFVMDGTNEYSKWSWGTDYDGTNLIRKLNEADLDTFPYVQSPKRFWAKREISRAGNPPTFASTGVVGGEDGEDTDLWPGGAETWQEGMAFTPGRINVGQTIPADWMIRPNGTNSWVYFTVGGLHIRQDVGGDTNAIVLVVLPQGRTTNVVYRVDNWYEAVISETGKGDVVGGRGTFTHTISPTGMVNVVATAQPQSDLAERYGLTADNPYTPSIMRWLAEEYGDYNVEDIRLGRFKGLNDADRVEWLTLNDMYWLDIPPVPETAAEKAMNDGTNWWLRAGITRMGIDHIITREEGGREVTYTNKQVEVKMYATNECTHADWAPGKLRGLDYTRSDAYDGVWTSVTFKVCGRLNLTSATAFMPFRTFTFTDGSFTGPAGDSSMDPELGPYSARIDILDPFQSPIGRNYGWDKHPSNQAYFMWKIDTEFYPYSIEKLKYDSTYQGD